MGIRLTVWVLAFAPAMFAVAQTAPATRPAVGPPFSSVVEPFDHRSPVAWLNRSIAAWKSVPVESGVTPGRTPSPLMLIALGQGATRDPALADTFALLRNEADTTDTPAGQAFAYVRLAMFPYPVGSVARKSELLNHAWVASRQVDSPFLKPLVDLEVLTALARAGELESAEAIARATEEVKPRAAQYCALAMAAAERGDTSAAGEYVRTARRLTTGQDDDTTSAILLKIGQAQAAFGDDRAVRLTVGTIPGPHWQVELLIDTARRQHVAHNIPGYLDSVRAAREAAEQLPVESRVAAIAPLATMQADAGDTPGARETISLARPIISELTNVRQRISTELNLAHACARAADSVGCMELLSAADDEKLKLPPGKTADGIPEAGDNDPLRQQAVRAIAALARAGQIDTATNLAKPYQSPGERDTINWALAEARASRGHLPDAVDYFDRLTSTTYRAWTARRIAEAYAARGQFVALDRFISCLPPAEKAWANLGAAEGLIGHRITDRRNSEFCQLGVD